MDAKAQRREVIDRRINACAADVAHGNDLAIGLQDDTLSLLEVAVKGVH